VFGLAPLPRTLTAAERDATHPRETVRRSAVDDLARHAARGEARAIASLATLLAEDSVAAIRGAAALALADAGAESAARAVLDATSDDALWVAQMALVALGELHSGLDDAGSARARLRLEVLLGSSDAELRYQALIAWCRIAPSDADTALERGFDDPDAEVRYIALRLAEDRWAAQEGFDPGARGRCRRALQDPSPRVRGAAAIVLGRFGDDAGRSELVRVVAGSAGASADDVQAAIELCADLGVTESGRALGRRAFGALLTGDPFAWHARIALSRLGSRRARDTILRGLGAWSRDARTLAVVAAGRAGLREAVATLEGMRRDPRRAEVGAVEEALDRIGGGSRGSWAPAPGVDSIGGRGSTKEPGDFE
jgi:HEAT repeat protein